MATINQIKQQQVVVKSVGDFADSLQKIAAARMVRLRRMVEASQHFVEESTVILRELELERTKQIEKDLGVKKSELTRKKPKSPNDKSLLTEIHTSIIVVTANQGLSGSYNTDIIKKVESVITDYRQADYYVIGAKGQEFFRKAAKKYNLRYYPYNIPEEVRMENLKPLIGMFYHYDQIFLVYSKFINTANREVVFVELTVPHIEAEEIKREEVEGKFIFEPSLEHIFESITARLRYALFRLQILDSKLSLYTAQMLAMKTATDNAQELLKDLKLEYNKARRKLIDKKIQEVQAGRSLWAEEQQ